MNPSNVTGRAARDIAHLPAERFHPFGTVRCSNPPFFRNQLSRDLACLLDVDDDVSGWCCRPYGMDEVLREIGWEGPPVDLMASYADGRDVYFHVVDGEGDPEVTEAAACRRVRHRFVTAKEIRAGCRLQNAKDLLRYANYQTPLGDRIRLLAALEQEGSATVAECLTLFREVSPMAGLSSLILHRWIAIDLDLELIAPHTTVHVSRR